MTQAVTAHAFLELVPDHAAPLVNLLAIPESLTDQVAEQLYALAPLADVTASQFIDAFKQTSFIQPRNSEWSLDSQTREAFLAAGGAPPNLVQQAHRLMLEHVETAKAEWAGSIMPSYLYTLAGKAYHQAGVGETDAALQNYERAATLPYSGAQWLAMRLGSEQQRLGIFSADQTEILFLQAITLFREGQRDRAKPLMEQIVAKGAPSLATAMALNILGNMEAGAHPKRAETLLRQGIEMSLEVGNDQGVVIGQHNLGVLIGRDRKRLDEAETLLRASITGGDESGNVHHAAVVRHSLAHLLNKAGNARQRKEAEELLRIAIRDLKDVHDEPGAGMAMHTLALSIAKDEKRSDEAEQMFLQSIEASEKSNDSKSTAMRLFTFARFLISVVHNLAEGSKILDRARSIAARYGLTKEVERIDEYKRDRLP